MGMKARIRTRRPRIGAIDDCSGDLEAPTHGSGSTARVRCFMHLQGALMAGEYGVPNIYFSDVFGVPPEVPDAYGALNVARVNELRAPRIAALLT